MSRMNAWVLDFGMGYTAALGEREVLHLIDVPIAFPVPCTPSCCSRVLFWQGKILPLMDVVSRLGGAPQQAPFVAVVGYQQTRGEYPHFGALQLAAPPRHVSVGDEQACQLPENSQGWRELAISCFNYQGEAIPVLDLNRLFMSPSKSGIPAHKQLVPANGV